MDTITSWLGKIRSLLPIPLQVATAPFSETAKVMDPESEDYQKWADQLPAVNKPVGWQEKGLEVPQISPDDLIGTGIPSKMAAVAGTFIGKKALTFDLPKALKTLSVPPEDAWRKFQTFTAHPDKQLRQEIDDSTAYLLTKAMKQDPVDYLKTAIPENTLSNILNHPELYKAYPKLADIKTKGAIKGGAKEAGEFNPIDNTIKFQGGSSEEAKSALLHEIQHWIQFNEHWQQGGTIKGILQEPEMYNLWAPLADTLMVTKGLSANEAETRAAYGVYRKLAGEAESRATQARMKMSPAERAFSYPEYSYDIPLNDLILRKD